MCSRRKTTGMPTSNVPPPYVLALEDYDPYQYGDVYDSQPTFSAPNVSTQLSFRKGEKFRVVSDELDWWILCEQVETKESGYVATILFAPLCATSKESTTEGDDDENDAVQLIPCVEKQNFDMKYFPNSPSVDREQAKKKPSPMESANIFSRLTFWWMTNLIVTGYRRPLNDHDLWDLNKDNTANQAVSKFQKKWQKQLRAHPKKIENDDSLGSSCDSGFENRPEGTHQDHLKNGVKFEAEDLKKSERELKENKDDFQVLIKGGKAKEKVPSIWRTLAQCFGSTFLFAACMKFFHDALLFVNPYLLRLIIQYIEGRGPQDTWRGYILALGLFIVATVQSMFLHQYFDKAVIVGLRARSAILGIVYRKMLKLSSKGRQIFTSGEMVNLMSVDATKFQDITTYLNMTWSAPFQIVTTLLFLYNLMGWSIFAGVVTMSLLLPINYFVSNRIKSAQTALMKQKDQRTRIMNDVLSGIKVLKLYSWEESFEKKIATLRSKELKLLRTVSLWKALVSFAFTCTPFLVSLATFAVYVLIGNELNAEKAFVAISLFNILQFPMTILPMIVTRIIACNVSVKRLTQYLQAEELDENNVIYSTNSDDPVAVKIENGSFTWDKESEFMLKNINFEAGRGSLIAIVGQVGCGKSSIISALLGEMQKQHGTVTVNGSVAYVPQQAWIQNATVEGNILFGKAFNAKKYKRVLEACALETDLKILPGGDLTEIGEKGINLSGGQKQRISIARALYNGADIYFFDDPLSAVDSHVALHLFDNVIGPQGLLRNKVRILVTHSLSLLSQVDKIIVMKNGLISEVGTYEELASSSSSYAELLRSFGDDDDDINECENTVLEKSVRKRPESVSSFGPRQDNPLEKVLDMKEYFDKQHKRVEKGQKVIQAESVQTGRVNLSVFAAYAKSTSLGIAVLVMLLSLSAKFFLVGTRVWLAGWSSKKSLSSKERDEYLLIYGLLGLGHCISTYLSSIFLTFGAFFAAKRLHNKLLTNVLRGPMHFFESTPMGRLTNRFSKDINVIDEEIPETVNSFLGCLFGIVSVIFTICYSTPLFLTALIPLAAVYVGTQRFYVSSSRQLKRLESIRRSPIYNHFFESINGVSSIRAQRQQQRFTNENERRIDDNQAAYAPSMYSNRWLAVRLEFVGNLIIFLSAMFTIVAKDSISSGLAGLSISYAMQITQTLNWFVRMTSKLETDIVAVERVKEYSEIETEAARINPNNRPDASWPDKGVVHVQDYCARYRKDLDYALTHINFDVKPCEKIGVVGRTGAGKSTLALTLFRVIEAAEGCIAIDGINIADIGLMDLRSRLTIIPQDPVLFSGSIRFNLDPFDQYPDDKLWGALEISHLKDFVNTLNGSLEEPVAEGGSNFSVGQRQLMCLARAILRKSKILVLDEATAAVDMETDEFIQKTIREEFKDCTVFTIAHRLNTVIDYDRILVLDKGKVMEFDSPQRLLQSKGIFYDMAKDANLL